MEEVHSSDSDGPSPTRFGVSDEHVSKLSEAYTFIGSITVFVAAGIFIIWAYVPNYWLEFVGIHYYPNRYWSLAIPSYVMVTIVVAIAMYTGLNFLATPPPTSLKSIFDEYGEDLLSLSGIAVTDDGEPAVEPLPNTSTDSVNLMLNELKSLNLATDEIHDRNQICGNEVSQHS